MLSKKWNGYAVLVAAALVVGVIGGCSGSNGNAAPSEPQSSTAASDSGGPEAAKPPVKLTILVASRVPDSPYTPDTPVWKELAKRTNVEFEFITGEYAQVEQQLKLLMASGDYPDIVAGPMSEFKKYGQQGALVDLAELIEQHAPNIRQYLTDDPAKRAETVAVDGGIYGIPLQTAIRTSEGYMVRQDWLDRLGLQPPETIDDWHNMLKAFKEQDANGNGDPNDEIPLMTDYSAYTSFADAWGIHIHPAGPRWIEEDGTIKFSPIDPRFKAYLQTMHQWYEEGLLDKEFLTRTDPDLERMAFTDKMGSGQHWVGYMAGYNAREDANKVPGFNFQVVAPPVLNQGDTPGTFRQQSALHSLGWAVSINNKHLEETIRLFDYVYSDEGQLLTNFGIEGDSYVMDNGNPVYTDKIMKDPDGSANALWRMGMQPLIGFRQDQRYERAYTATKDIEKQLFFYEEQNYFRTPFPSLNFTEEEEKRLADIRTPLFTYIDEMTPKFIIGTEDLDQFDKYVERVRSMKFDEFESIYKAAYERYQAEFAK